MAKNNNQNLIPLNKRSKEAAKAIQTAGGVARGEQQTKAKGMREWVRIFGETGQSVTMPDGSTVDTTMLGAVVLGQIRAAQKGNTKAATLLSDLLGERNINIAIGEGEESRPEINIE